LKQSVEYDPQLKSQIGRLGSRGMELGLVSNINNLLVLAKWPKAGNTIRGSKDACQRNINRETRFLRVEFTGLRMRPIA